MNTSGARVSFQEGVLAAISALRPGEIASYGAIATRAGRPGAARAVGNILSRTEARVPWWRVVRAGGVVVKGERQARLLSAEGIQVTNGRVADPALRRKLTAGL
jgi:methylated-DNA-protein-cysteine methyltransferase-like protein